MRLGDTASKGTVSMSPKKWKGKIKRTCYEMQPDFYIVSVFGRKKKEKKKKKKYNKSNTPADPNY